jgi:cyclopropane fatty-acyl-phospholipid synthase-like methyltransferase
MNAPKVVSVVAESIDLLNDSGKVLSKKDRVITYYENAGPDYQAWSKNYNMHFGYFEKGINPLNREAMLENLNLQVFKRLQIERYAHGTIADFGCGLGASLRFGVKHFPNIKMKGITIVPWQVAHAGELCKQSPASSRIEILEADYTRTRFEPNSIDAVIAIESSCYAAGDNKADLLKEIHRVLKPGGKFVISDGFLKHGKPLNKFLDTAYNTLCNSWALDELGNIQEVERTLQWLGFYNIKVEDISLNVAPSVAHVPWTVFTFLIKQFIAGKKKMSKERWDNLKSPLLTMILGSARSHFGYYLVSGTKQI